MSNSRHLSQEEFLQRQNELLGIIEEAKQQGKTQTWAKEGLKLSDIIEQITDIPFQYFQAECAEFGIELRIKQLTPYTPNIPVNIVESPVTTNQPQNNNQDDHFASLNDDNEIDYQQQFNSPSDLQQLDFDQFELERNKLITIFQESITYAESHSVDFTEALQLYTKNQDQQEYNFEKYKEECNKYGLKAFTYTYAANTYVELFDDSIGKTLYRVINNQYKNHSQESATSIADNTTVTATENTNANTPPALQSDTADDTLFNTERNKIIYMFKKMNRSATEWKTNFENTLERLTQLECDAKIGKAKFKNIICPRYGFDLKEYIAGKQKGYELIDLKANNKVVATFRSIVIERVKKRINKLIKQSLKRKNQDTNNDSRNDKIKKQKLEEESVVDTTPLPLFDSGSPFEINMPKDEPSPHVNLNLFQSNNANGAINSNVAVDIEEIDSYFVDPKTSNPGL